MFNELSGGRDSRGADELESQLAKKETEVSHFSVDRDVRRAEESKNPAKSGPRRFEPSSRRLLIVLFSALTSLLALFPAAQVFHGQVIRPFTVRFSQNARGDIGLIGNTLLTCNPALPPSNPATQPPCNPNGPGQNNFYRMIYVDIDGDAATFNSSSAVLNLPAGANLLFAGLY